jgi:hypothetical protein
MKLSQLVEDRRTVTIPVGTGTITLGYNPGGVTPRMFAMADEAQDGTVNIANMVAMMVPMLIDWDVTDDDDRPLPLTAAGLMDVPIQILVKVMEVIGEDIAVPKASSAPSGSGLSVAGSQDALPPGISSFARDVTSA